MKRFSLLLTAAVPLALFGACTSEAPSDPVSTGGSGNDTGDTGGAGNEAGAPGKDVGGAGGETGSDPEPQIPDPAPEYSEPGAYVCDGCPESDRESFVLDAGPATSARFTGIVTGIDGDGTYYLRGPGGAALEGIVPVDDEGSYSIELPLFCGQQLLKLLWTNASGTTVEVVNITTEDCVEADIRVTLSWDAVGRDWELHLIKPGGRINDDATDCTWTSCISSSPDWGVEGDPSDDPHKDVDNTGAYGPENIWLAKPEPGIYTVMVEHWAAGDPTSSGQVIFNVAGEVVVARMENLAPYNVWTEGTIEWPSGKVTIHDDVYDCSEDWSGGCYAELP